MLYLTYICPRSSMDRTGACGASNRGSTPLEGTNDFFMELSTPVEKIPRVGPAFLKKLHKLGIKTVGQLLYHFPHRYEDFSNLIPISQAQIGGPFCFQGKITDIKNIRTFRKRMMLTQATLGRRNRKTESQCGLTSPIL